MKRGREPKKYQGKTIAEWVEITGLSIGGVKNRIATGRALDEAKSSGGRKTGTKSERQEPRLGRESVVERPLEAPNPSRDESIVVELALRLGMKCVAQSEGLIVLMRVNAA